MIEELLNRFTAVGALYRQLTDRLQTVSDSVFLSLGFCRCLYGFRMLEFEFVISHFRVAHLYFQLNEPGLLAGMLFVRGTQCLPEGRNLIPSFGLLEFEPACMRLDAADHFFSAGNLIPDSRFTCDSIKLFLAKLFDGLLFEIAALREFRQRRGQQLNLRSTASFSRSMADSCAPLASRSLPFRSRSSSIRFSRRQVGLPFFESLDLIL